MTSIVIFGFFVAHYLLPRDFIYLNLKAYVRPNDSKNPIEIGSRVQKLLAIKNKAPKIYVFIILVVLRK